MACLLVRNGHYPPYTQMIFGIIAAIGVLLLLYLLLTPLIIEIDTANDLYQVRLVGCAKAEMLVEDLPKCRLTILGFTRIIPSGKKSEPKEAKPRKAKRKFRVSRLGRKIIHVLRSFRVRRFYVDIDTDDYILNANLYPLARLLAADRRAVRVNFNGVNAVDLVVTNSIGRMLAAYLR